MLRTHLKPQSVTHGDKQKIKSRRWNKNFETEQIADAKGSMQEAGLRFGANQEQIRIFTFYVDA